MEPKEFLNKKTPLQKFAEWFEEAQAAYAKYPGALQYAEAFVLSTSFKNEVTSRVLLMKEIRKDGLIFYTNYKSTKATQMMKNPKVAINFFWHPLFRQVNMRGTVKKISKQESEKYWYTRPRESQITQFISQQSQPAIGRAQLEKEWAAAESHFANQSVPLPKNWGGYLFAPTYVEFWIGRDGRFHDRYACKKNKSSWLAQRLYP